jgi:hypothetical protein
MGGKFVHVDTAAVGAQGAQASTGSVTAVGSSADEQTADTLSDV